MAATRPCGELALLKVRQLLLRSSFSAEEETKEGRKKQGTACGVAWGSESSSESPAGSTGALSLCGSQPRLWQGRTAVLGLLAHSHSTALPRHPLLPCTRCCPTFPAWERLLRIYEEFRSYFSSQAPRANTTVNLSVNRQALEGR